jgi:hypothetical protein
MARTFITDALAKTGRSTEPFATDRNARRPRVAHPEPEHMFWFEYNFLYVLAGGRPRREIRVRRPLARPATSSALASTRSANEGRLNFARNIASYLIFLAENTGLASAAACAAARTLLGRYTSLDAMLADVSH